MVRSDQCLRTIVKEHKYNFEHHDSIMLRKKIVGLSSRLQTTVILSLYLYVPLKERNVGLFHCSTQNKKIEVLQHKNAQSR